MATTLTEILKANSEKAIQKVDAQKLSAEIAKVCAKHFAPYRREQISMLYADASGDELEKEIAAFNADTQNGTRLLYRLSSTDKLDGKTIYDKDGKILFENAEYFATLNTTNKDGETIRTTSLFSIPFTPDTATRNNRVITYWIENYRSTIEDSFAYAKQLEREQKEKAEREAKTQLLAGLSLEELQALLKKAGK